MSKPPYCIPSMVEINALPPNGRNVISLFSGAGGSCLGYRMAGFRVLWANEFVPAAQASYRANSSSILDCRDIRLVKPEEILSATGIKKGELDLLDGSPPCQSFSTAGKREKGWGKGKRYEHGAVQCNETLFGEYVRILRGLMPRVFVAENVSGLVKGKAKGWFLEILRDLKASGYVVEAKLLDAQWLGVPQMRQRIIFQGVRSDLGKMPVWPKPLPYRYSVRDALSHVVSVTAQPHGPNSRPNDSWSADKPAPAGTAGGPHLAQYYKHKLVVDPDTGTSLTLPPSRRGREAFNTQDVRPDEPCPTVTTASPGNDLRVSHDEGGQWSQGNITDGPAPTGRSGRIGTMFIEGANGFNGHAESSDKQPMPTVQSERPVNDVDCQQRRKFTIAELKRICAFPDDFILVGSYAQAWSCLGNAVPPVMMKYLAEAICDHVLS